VQKNDRTDAQTLAWVDPQLLSPIRHRGEQEQAELAAIRARAKSMESRTDALGDHFHLVRIGGHTISFTPAACLHSLIEPRRKERYYSVLE
jgi:hypothetical protein